MRLDEGPSAVRLRQPRRAREGARVDARGPGQWRDRPEGRRRADVRHSRSNRRRRDSGQPLSAHAHQRRLVREGRPLLSAAGRRRGARTAPARSCGSVEGASSRADGQQQHHHARPKRSHGHLRASRASRRANAASAPRDDHHQAAGPVDAHGNGAEEPRRAAQGDGADCLRDRRPHAGHEVGCREGVSGLRRRCQTLRFRRRPPDAGRAVRRAVPDSRPGVDPRPDLQRRRRRHRRQLVSGQDRHRSHADRVDDSARACGSQHRDDARCAAGRHRSAGPGPRQPGGRGRRLRARREDRRGDLLDAVSRPSAHGARQRHRAGYQRPRGHLDRRSESPGNALQRLEDHRYPGAERLRPPVPPRWRLRPQRQRTRRPSTRS